MAETVKETLKRLETEMLLRRAMEIISDKKLVPETAREHADLLIKDLEDYLGKED